MERKKILLIIPEMMMGGAQRSMSKLSLEFSKHHTVWLVVFHKLDGIAYPHGGELISLEVVPTGGIFNKIKSFIQRINQLKKLKKDLDIDVSISFLEGADYVNILSRVHDKVILSIRGSKRHDETIEGNFSFLRNKILIPWLYRKADVIITVNQGIANELQTFYKLGQTNMVTIGNFYHVEEITKLATDPKNENLNRLYTDPVLIATGRLAPEKGLKQLLHVFHQLKNEYPKLRFVIVGEGNELENLISTAHQLSLKVHVGDDFQELPDVIFVGRQSNVFKFLRGSRIFLMNSSSEGFPNGMAEAMICGLPVVSSDCPYGPREILAPEFIFSSSITEPYASPYGILMPLIFSERDIKTWATTLGKLLEQQMTLDEIGKKGMNRVATFDSHTILSLWYNQFEKDV